MSSGRMRRVDEAIRQVQKETGSDVVVVKAQIHAGGRGKGGGVKVARGFDDAQAKARAVPCPSSSRCAGCAAWISGPRRPSPGRWRSSS